MNKIKFVTSSLFSIIILLGLSTAVTAALSDNGNGTVTQTRNDGSMLMWLQDANTISTSGYCLIPGNCFDTSGRLNWGQANDWIGSLNSSNYLGYSDWRLPYTLPVNGSSYDYNYSYNGSTDWGYNVSAPGSAYPGSTGSEMAYMYYTELGNLGWADTSGNPYQPGWGLNNIGPFINLQPVRYWSGSLNQSAQGPVWAFNFEGGGQTGCSTDHCYNAWAVRTVVPEPISSILFLTGGTLLAGRRYIKRKKKA